MKKPTLICHPGFAKCATTSLQALFYRNDHVVARDCGVVWIGEGFVSFGRMPPVFEIGDDPNRAIRRVESMHLDANLRYFLSAESLQTRPNVMSALAERFRIERCVFTIRFPFFLELSEYCFRGWLKESIEAALLTGLKARIKMMERILEMSDQVSGVDSLLCPIDFANLEARFCSLAFGCTPDSIEKVKAAIGTSRNESTHPCFAVALHAAVQDAGLQNLPLKARRNLMRAAQSIRVPEELDAYLPESVLALLDDRSIFNRHIRDYKTLLSGRSVPTEQVDLLEENVRRRLDKMRARVPPPASVSATLRQLASGLIERSNLNGTL